MRLLCRSGLLFLLSCSQTEGPAPELIDLPVNEMPGLQKSAPPAENRTPRVWYRDADGDGYTRAGDTRTSIADPDGPGLEWVSAPTQTDCDDDPDGCGAGCHPGMTSDTCDGLDQDCDGLIDEDPTLVWYRDLDLDGAGDPNATLVGCEAPEGYVESATDCDDDPQRCGARCRPGLPENLAAATCQDGFDNDCDGRTDLEAPSCDDNRAPLARFVVSPGAAPVASPFTFNAGPTQDLEDPDGALRYEWDFDEDGITDVEKIGTTQTDFQFDSPGVKTVRLRVIDTGGRFDDFVGHVLVAELEEDLIVVTSTADHVTGYDGVTTLREAMILANQRPGPDVITFGRGLDVNLTAQLPQLTDAGTSIVGRPGVTIVGGPAATDFCLGGPADSTTILWISIRSCPEDAIEISGDQAWVAHVRSFDNGDDGVDFNSGNNRLGPNVRSFGNGDAGFEIEGPMVVIFGNRVSNNRHGIRLRDGNPAQGAMVLANEVSFNETGITVAAGVNDAAIWHNTVHGNGADGIDFAPPLAPGEPVGQQHDVRNNIISGNAGAGILSAASFSALSTNLWFANGVEDCSGCSAAGLSADPAFLDPEQGDLRLLLGSPAVDQGEILGLDVNGMRSGGYDGAGPDLGAYEQAN